MIKSKENSIGAWAFLIGVVLAIIVGLATTIVSIPTLVAHSAQIYAILAILGFIVGFATVPGRDSQTFLWTGAILVVVSSLGMNSVRSSLIGVGIGDAVSSIFGALLAMFVPATIIVALKTLFSVAKI